MCIRDRIGAAWTIAINVNSLIIMEVHLVPPGDAAAPAGPGQQVSDAGGGGGDSVVLLVITNTGR